MGPQQRVVFEGDGMDADGLREWMDQHRYSVRRLAAALERDPKTIARYRSGELPVPRILELALQALVAAPPEPPEDLSRHLEGLAAPADNQP
jgi:transcriptional regulator with XRE-family HTH domain